MRTQELHDDPSPYDEAAYVARELEYLEAGLDSESPPEPVDTPPPPTLFDMLMEANPERRALVQELMPHINNIHGFKQAGAVGGNTQPNAEVDWVLALAIGLAITGYNSRLSDLLPSDVDAARGKITTTIYEALRKEQQEATRPQSPWNLIKASAKLYANY